MAYKSVQAWVLRALSPRFVIWISRFKGLSRHEIGRVLFIGDAMFCALGAAAMEKLQILDPELSDKIANGLFHYTVLHIEGHNVQNYYSGIYSVRATSTASEIALMIFVVRRYYLSICTGRRFSAFFFQSEITRGILDSEQLVTEWQKQKGLDEWVEESRRDFRT